MHWKDLPKMKAKKIPFSDTERMRWGNSSPADFCFVIMVNSLGRREMTGEEVLDLHKEIRAPERVNKWINMEENFSTFKSFKISLMN